MIKKLNPTEESFHKLQMEQIKLKLKNKRLLQTYGINLIEWATMSANGCWICRRKEGRLCVDHRHVKGYKHLPLIEKRKEVRACLCFMCNTMLHGVEKRKNARFFLERMVDYFKFFKMKGDE